MDIDTRIRRRERRRDEQRLVLDYQALNPVAHVDDPPGRGPIFERILDYLDPVFDGEMPVDATLYGPRGSGKSAVVSALFARLADHATTSQSVIYTSTRAQTTVSPAFVYLDAREANSQFQLYHAALAALRDDSVPEQGISTEELRSQLRSELATASGAVVAVDHVGDPACGVTDDLGGGREVEEPSQLGRFAHVFAGLDHPGLDVALERVGVALEFRHLVSEVSVVEEDRPVAQPDGELGHVLQLDERLGSPLQLRDVGPGDGLA
jgi:hypothetical protein